MRLAPTPLAFQGRISFFRTMVVASFLLVLAGYYRIQILYQEQYEQLGENNRIKKTPIKASRGLIYDRNGQLITQNMPTYNLVLHRDEMEEPWRQLRPRLSAFLGVAEAELDHAYNQRSHLLSQPVKLMENISFAESVKIRRNRNRFRGLDIDTIEKRFYTYGHLFSHVLGYVREVSREKLLANPKYKMGDIVGQSGMELAYNNLLTGLDGERTILIDNRGVYRSQQISAQPQPGGDLFLTIDFQLQEMAFDALNGRGGTVIVMDAKSGEILVYISSPAFDLNLFTKGISKESWEALLQSPGKPFLNRPIQGAYAPGSVFKLVTALAALKHQKINLNTKYYCAGAIDFYGRVRHCHRRSGHGQVDLVRAIQGSCNVFFYHIAKDLEPHYLADMAFEMGLGELTGVDLRGEKPGLVPTAEWKKKRFREIWYPGDTLSLAIGQGDLQATPLQLAVLMATLANQGKVPKPHFLLKSRKSGQFTYRDPKSRSIAGVPKNHFDILKTAMWRVVNQSEGTGSNARVPGFDVCGKTGTAQLITFTSEADHKIDANKNAWFAGFAPRKDPEIVVLVLVEQAGAGGANAAPIAKMLFEAFYKRRFGVDPS